MGKAGIYQSDIPWQISHWKADISILQYIVAELLHGEQSLKADRAFLERDLSLLLPLSGSTHSLARIWVFLSFSIRRTLFPIVRIFHSNILTRNFLDLPQMPSNSIHPSSRGRISSTSGYSHWGLHVLANLWRTHRNAFNSFDDCILEEDPKESNVQ
jgi:hypothetical protein